jgi:hypothetical protein
MAWPVYPEMNPTAAIAAAIGASENPRGQLDLLVILQILLGVRDQLVAESHAPTVRQPGGGADRLF